MPSTDPDCIFCKILAGQIPCHRVFENDHVMAFLDIGPLARGHTLVIPRNHYERIDQMPAAAAAELFKTVPALAAAVLDATGRGDLNVLQNNGKLSGQEVDHVHVHLIPRQAEDGLGFRWPAGALDEDDAKTLIERMRSKLQA